MTTKLRQLALAGLLVVAGGAVSCGGVTDARTSARDQATKAACDRYNACGLIGTDMGDAYATYDSCATVWRSNWEQAWPASTCMVINQAGLNVCLSAIAATDCVGFDFLSTLGKCQAQDVCVSAADAGDQS
jgi:hypothetical protein